MSINIIADVAGRFNELMALLAMMPLADKIILVGDIIDRGQDSKKVVEWAMANKDKVICLKGNHEDMMVDAYEYEHGFSGGYQPGIWLMNGGRSTLISYGLDSSNIGSLPADHIHFMKNNPIFYQEDGLFVSHAPWKSQYKLGEMPSQHYALWNRDDPKEREGVYQVFGHNTYTQTFGDYAICLDNSGNDVLQGLYWPTKEIFKQDYYNMPEKVGP